jgi:hypothetical protein
VCPFHGGRVSGKHGTRRSGFKEKTETAGIYRGGLQLRRICPRTSNRWPFNLLTWNPPVPENSGRSQHFFVGCGCVCTKWIVIYSGNGQLLISLLLSDYRVLSLFSFILFLLSAGQMSSQEKLSLADLRLLKSSTLWAVNRPRVAI